MSLRAGAVLAILGLFLPGWVSSALARENSRKPVPVEDRIFIKLQSARASEGITPLIRDERLDDAARRRAQEMAQAPARQRLSQQRSATNLVRDQGIEGIIRVRERVDLQLGSRRPAVDTLKRWQQAPEAWQAAIDPNATRIGLATATAKDGWLIFVAFLAQVREVPEDLSEWADQIRTQIDEIRRDRGLPTLKRDSALDAAALTHSQDMALRDFFDHVSPDHDSPADRVRRQHRTFYRVGENISYNLADADPVGTAVEGWMNSPGHRAHILDPHFVFTGVGVAQAEDGGFYFTQVFLEESPSPARTP